MGGYVLHFLAPKVRTRIEKLPGGTMARDQLANIALANERVRDLLQRNEHFGPEIASAAQELATLQESTEENIVSPCLRHRAL
jgi:hypothetical protein